MGSGRPECYSGLPENLKASPLEGLSVRQRARLSGHVLDARRSSLLRQDLEDVVDPDESASLRIRLEQTQDHAVRAEAHSDLVLALDRVDALLDDDVAERIQLRLVICLQRVDCLHERSEEAAYGVVELLVSLVVLEGALDLEPLVGVDDLETGGILWPPREPEGIAPRRAVRQAASPPQWSRT